MRSTRRLVLLKLAAASAIPVAAGLAIAVKKAADYSVARGDTLSGIAARNGTSWQELARYNGISDPRRLHVGQPLRIPPRQKPPLAAPVRQAPVASAPAPAPRVQRPTPPAVTSPYPGRNNNPMNLRDSGTNWDGRVNRGVTDGSKFVMFRTANDGLNAGSRNLYVQASRMSSPTLRRLFAKTTPPGENNTDKYVSDISTAAGIDPDAVLDRKNPTWLRAIMPHVVRFESGVAASRHFKPADYAAAYKRAIRPVRGV